jgi:murein DD-endopeptidase MepM/ murein hydrolase activator NlpD
MRPRIITAVLVLIAALIVVVPKTFTLAQSVDELQNSIVQSTSQIDKLKQEITQLQSQLTATSKQKQTLQSAVTGLDLNIKKITASIALTNAQISQKDAQIAVLSHGISTTTNKIGDVQSEVGDSLRGLMAIDDEPPALALFGGETLSSVFDNIATLATVRDNLESRVHQLGNLKTSLTSTRDTAQEKRQELAVLQQNLTQQQQSLAIARQSQADLLAQTKNQESNYQSLLAQKKAQEAKFEKDLLAYEAQLNLKVTPGSLPPSGSSPLRWPLDSVIITQYFGNTPFATANSQIYNGHGHTGIDLGASPGTPVHAARAGVVLGTGNTDATCPGASFGKWVFIKHDDGISTLYAHLASFAVAKGDSVATGQVIGYSDTTGYATGPHLHFGVYASSGSEIASFPSSSCKGKTYTMPVGDVSAYLNPLSYLPAQP